MKLPSYTGFPALALLCSGLFLAAISTTAMAQWAGSASAPVQSIDTAVEAPDENIQSIIPSSGSGLKVTYGADQPDGEDTHPALRLTPDKSELVRLDNDVASVVVGNPNHLGVLMDNPRLLILLPRQPGATYLTLMDVDGNVLMQRHVLVASPKSDYVRIRRSCGAAGNAACEQTSVYYCPGVCHEVGMNDGKGSGNVPPPMLSSSARNILNNIISGNGNNGAEPDTANGGTANATEDTGEADKTGGE